MKFHIYQIVILIISAMMLYQGVTRYIKGKSGQTILKLMIRIMAWGGIALIAIFPNFSNVLAKIIGLEGNVNAVILTGFIFVFLMMFKMLSLIEQLEQNISAITRDQSLEKIKNTTIKNTQ
jgi:hypothetical protein